MRKKFLSIRSQKGVTMIEYALIGALVAVVAIAAIRNVGTKANAKFNLIGNKLKSSSHPNGGNPD